MEIKTRKQAMIDGENTYFTGKPCKNGHMSYRYVQSGTCYDCINSTRLSQNSPTSVAREQRLSEAAMSMHAKNMVKENLALIKVRLFAAEREGVALIAYALAAMRFPMLNVSDIDPRVAPISTDAAGSSLYQFYCHTDDIAVLRSAANDTFKKYVPDFEVKRRELAEKSAAYLPKDTTPPMNFK